MKVFRNLVIATAVALTSLSCSKDQDLKPSPVGQETEKHSSLRPNCPLCIDTYVTINSVTDGSNCGAVLSYTLYQADIDLNRPDLIIERSGNATSWVPIKYIYASQYSTAGPSSTTNFSFTDANPYFPGVNGGTPVYYRMRTISNTLSMPDYTSSIKSYTLKSPKCSNLPGTTFLDLCNGSYPTAACTRYAVINGKSSFEFPGTGSGSGTIIASPGAVVKVVISAYGPSGSVTNFFMSGATLSGPMGNNVYVSSGSTTQTFTMPASGSVTWSGSFSGPSGGNGYIGVELN